MTTPHRHGGPCGQRRGERGCHSGVHGDAGPGAAAQTATPELRPTAYGAVEGTQTHALALGPDGTGSETTSLRAVEAAYGFLAFGRRFTGSPHVGFGLSAGARDCSVGWRLTPEAATAPDLSFGIRATRRESGT